MTETSTKNNRKIQNMNVILCSPKYFSLHLIIFLFQFRYRGQPNYFLPINPRLNRPNQQVRHFLPPAASGERLDLRGREGQPASGLREDQGVQPHHPCGGQ